LSSARSTDDGDSVVSAAAAPPRRWSVSISAGRSQVVSPGRPRAMRSHSRACSARMITDGIYTQGGMRVPAPPAASLAGAQVVVVLLPAAIVELLPLALRLAARSRTRRKAPLRGCAPTETPPHKTDLQRETLGGAGTPRAGAHSGCSDRPPAWSCSSSEPGGGSVWPRAWAVGSFSCRPL
jgi:hypothetical protein